jgi:uncharacterized protein involved in response to NO
MSESREPQAAAGRSAAVLFSDGFRMFFPAAGVVAAMAVPLWTIVFLSGWSGDGALPVRLWHAHEMLFGYAIAALAGFLLTAMPNWTGTPALGHPGLGILFGLWVLGRMAMAASMVVESSVVAAVDVLFPAALAIYAGGVLWRAGNRRNLVIVAVIALIVFADAAFHLSLLDILPLSPSTALAAVLNAFILLIALIGGRVVPAFTRNALARAGQATPIRSIRWLDILTLVTTACILPIDLIAPESHGAAAVTLVAALANTLRFLTWQTERTLGSPILWVLHLAYLWLIAGLYMKGLAASLPGLAGLVWMHALAAGAIGSMTLAIMTRAALGHAGLPLHAAPATVAAYVLVSFGALARIVAPELPAEWFAPVLGAAGAAWSLAFILFLVVYVPICATPPPGAQPDGD